MPAKAYISNIATGWPVERQEALLAKHVPGWPAVTIYRDILDARTRQAHQPGDLVNRAAMLRPTGRQREGETIYVASLVVLAWGKDDFAEVLTLAARRGAAIWSVDNPCPQPSPVAFAEAKREASRKQARENGTKAAAERRAAAAEAKAMPYKTRWRDKAERTEDLLREMGLSRNTASKYLGRRELVLKRVEAQLKRKARDEQAEAK